MGNASDVNTQEKQSETPLDKANDVIANLLRKPGAKIAEELKAYIKS